MSAFLPEQSQNAPSGITEFSPANPQTTTDDVALMQRVFQAAAQNPLMLPADFMAYLFDYIQTSRLQVPIGQVFGFQRFLSTQVTAFLNTDGSLSVGAHVTDTAAGPSLSGLVPGSYILIASFDQSGLDAASLVTSTGLSVTQNPSAQLYTLTGTSITSTLSATGGGAGGSIGNCWLLALRYDN